MIFIQIQGSSDVYKNVTINDHTTQTHTNIGTLKKSMTSLHVHFNGAFTRKILWQHRESNPQLLISRFLAHAQPFMKDFISLRCIA